ncbi:ABC-2 type transport system permease protein [Kitasatospora sp. MAP12-15]|uniref:ABC transporter permease n=1 Tax=unclassified Kitasatospora TaxID=2633591 RepID=UPI002474A375|nr:ABC transporter permease [Kitasatospora sp. MAP12-44]MDH6108608.1 ABC-2 type transport system permease protein [Kitasatospora sp. MAP12-44]
MTSAVFDTAGDAYALAGRHMKHLIRVPQKLLGTTVMPMAYVAIFGYLFGSVITVPGGSYREYIMAGIFTQMMLSTAANTALGVTGDLGNGLVDRFRSLPIARGAVLIGRTTADVALAAVSCVLMALVGLLIGWRVHHGVLEALAGFGVLIAFGYTMTWLGAFMGMALRTPEAVNAIAFLIIMPLTFLSNAFIPLDHLPSWLRAVCEWNPISVVAAAVRQLFGDNAAVTTHLAFPEQHPVLLAPVLILLMLAVLIPLAIRAGRSAVNR